MLGQTSGDFRMNNNLDCVVLEVNGGPKVKHLMVGQNKLEEVNSNAYMYANGRISLHNMNSISLDFISS